MWPSEASLHRLSAKQTFEEKRPNDGQLHHLDLTVKQTFPGLNWEDNRNCESTWELHKRRHFPARIDRSVGTFAGLFFTSSSISCSSEWKCHSKYQVRTCLRWPLGSQNCNNLPAKLGDPWSSIKPVWWKSVSRSCHLFNVTLYRYCSEESLSWIDILLKHKCRPLQKNNLPTESECCTCRPCGTCFNPKLIIPSCDESMHSL